MEAGPMTLDSGRTLAIVRFAFGGYFLTTGLNKMQAGWLGSGDPLLGSSIGPALERNTAESFYRPFLENVVQPNIGLFSQFVAIAEVSVGLCLVLGLLVRPACVVALF